jgi:hypothetical protein
MNARVSTSEKIRQIVHDIDLLGNASLTRLTVLTKWLEASNRLRALGLWIASRAASENAGMEPKEAALIEKARVFLQGMNKTEKRNQTLNRRSIEALHNEAAQYKREFRRQQWGSVRVVNSWPLVSHRGRSGTGPRGSSASLKWLQASLRLGAELRQPLRQRIQRTQPSKIADTCRMDRRK